MLRCRTPLNESWHDYTPSKPTFLGLHLIPYFPPHKTPQMIGHTLHLAIYLFIFFKKDFIAYFCSSSSSALKVRCDFRVQFAGGKNVYSICTVSENVSNQICVS